MGSHHSSCSSAAFAPLASTARCALPRDGARFPIAAAGLPVAARRALPVTLRQEAKRRPTRGDHRGAVGFANVDYHGHIHPVALLLDRAFRPDDADMPLWILRCAFGPRISCAPMPSPQPPHLAASVAGAHVRSEGAIRSFWVFLSLSLLVDCVWVYKSSGLTPFTWEQLEQLQRQARAPGGKPCTWQRQARTPGLQLTTNLSLPGVARADRRKSQSR